jgi:hypothetical protein
VRLTTVQQEQRHHRSRQLIEAATFDAVAKHAEPFSYRDIGWATKRLAPHDDWHRWGWVEALMREMVAAGMLETVRAFDPPSQPHLFRRSGDWT